MSTDYSIKHPKYQSAQSSLAINYHMSSDLPYLTPTPPIDAHYNRTAIVSYH
jgi:hypothetical protein